MENISKTFGPVIALKDVSFKARPGTIHALCGENGAGKSTLMKVLAGVHSPDNGKIFINHKEHIFTEPGQALAQGISMLYQELDLAEDMTVYENIFMGRELMSKMPFMINRKKMISETQKLIDKNNFRIWPEAVISSLTPGECQIVELLKALMRQAKIIVMDEPTSSLSEVEAATLFKIVKQLRDKGLTIIYISHRMEEIMDLADDISILRDGEVVHSAPKNELTISEIVKHMVGRELKDFYPARNVEIEEVLFEAINLCSNEGIKDISFDVCRGEIVGMAGLVGAGRSETARAIFGVHPLTSGEIFLDGYKLEIKRPADAIKNGIAFLTEDRKRTGLCTNLPCSWNISLPNYENINMKHILNLSREKHLADDYGRKIKVKWSSPDAPADSLSGGNQQKVLVARWLMANSDFMIFDEPTRGIDVGAKKEVYTILNELAAHGKAILVISSDLPELFGITDRILVMRHGKLTGDLQTKETTPEEVMHLAAVEEKSFMESI